MQLTLLAVLPIQIVRMLACGLMRFEASLRR